jgi:hypothetical protein
MGVGLTYPSKKSLPIFGVKGSPVGVCFLVLVALGGHSFFYGFTFSYLSCCKIGLGILSVISERPYFYLLVLFEALS